jgi:hypothetical protein
VRVRLRGKMSDGLYRAEWTAIVDWIRVAQSRSLDRFVEYGDRWVALDDVGKVNRVRQGIYQMFLLEECLKHVVDPPIAVAKLVDLAEGIYPWWTRVTRLDRSDLILILKERAYINEEGEHLRDDKAFLGVVVALALLTADANVDVERFRPALASFCHDQPEFLRGLGID